MSGTSSLALPDRVRLAKLLGMLGSDHAGERDAAALAASRLVQERGTTWRDLLGTDPAPARPAANENTALSVCLANLALLNDWERTFVLEMRATRIRSGRQTAKLQQIAAKFRSN